VEALVQDNELVVLDSTAHGIKFAGFQQMYFNDALPPEYEVTSWRNLRNHPIDISSPVIQIPSTGAQDTDAYRSFIVQAGEKVAELIGL
jgi:threonine synthase